MVTIRDVKITADNPDVVYFAWNERVYVALNGESKADGGPYSVNHPNPASFNIDGTGFHQGFYDFDVNGTDIWVCSDGKQKGLFL